MYLVTIRITYGERYINETRKCEKMIDNSIYFRKYSFCFFEPFLVKVLKNLFIKNVRLEKKEFFLLSEY